MALLKEELRRLFPTWMRPSSRHNVHLSWAIDRCWTLARLICSAATTMNPGQKPRASLGGGPEIRNVTLLLLRVVNTHFFHLYISAHLPGLRRSHPRSCHCGQFKAFAYWCRWFVHDTANACQQSDAVTPKATRC